jgi:hypothetical protein
VKGQRQTWQLTWSWWLLYNIKASHCIPYI